MNEHDDDACMCPWHVRQRNLVLNHDEAAAHLDVDVVAANIELGED